MADIVERLRYLEKQQGEDYIWRNAKAAADEIERLREILARMKTTAEAMGPNGVPLGRS